MAATFSGALLFSPRLLTSRSANFTVFGMLLAQLQHALAVLLGKPGDDHGGLDPVAGRRVANRVKTGAGGLECMVFSGGLNVIIAATKSQKRPFLMCDAGIPGSTLPLGFAGGWP